MEKISWFRKALLHARTAGGPLCSSSGNRCFVHRQPGGEYVCALAWGGNIFTAFLIAIVIGIILGLINGLLVHYLRVPVIIITIATLNIYFGLMYVITQGKLINNIPQFFKDFGNVLLFPAKSPTGGTYGLSLMPLLWLAALILGWFIRENLP
jgi:ribose/xylose/arabinose/galactoside ABC-type transport system permease subunit